MSINLCKWDTLAGSSWDLVFPEILVGTSAGCCFTGGATLLTGSFTGATTGVGFGVVIGAGTVVGVLTYY